MATKKNPAVELEVGGRTVRLSSPDKVYFPEHGHTKLDVAQYYLAVGEGIVRALRERPTMLHRYPDGLEGEKVHQKRLPKGAPDWVETVELFFPRYSLTADELCVSEVAQVIWAVQMSTVEFHPWNVLRADVDRPDEWRIDVDPGPKATFEQVRRVTDAARHLLDELGIAGFPKTSGGNGVHVLVRIEPEWEFEDVRRAALAFARELERRLPKDVTTAWWRKDRAPDAVFVDYNQNARDHTLAATYSLRGLPGATASAPFRWDELADVEPRELTLATVPARLADVGELHAGIDDVHHRLDTLLEWAARDEADPALQEPPPPRDDEGAGKGKSRQQVAPSHLARVRGQRADEAGQRSR